MRGPRSRRTGWTAPLPLGEGWPATSVKQRGSRPLRVDAETRERHEQRGLALRDRAHFVERQAQLAGHFAAFARGDARQPVALRQFGGRPCQLRLARQRRMRADEVGGDGDLLQRLGPAIGQREAIAERGVHHRDRQLAQLDRDLQRVAVGAGAIGSASGSSGSAANGVAGNVAASGCGCWSRGGAGGTRGRSISGTTTGPIGPIRRRSQYAAASPAPPNRNSRTTHGQYERLCCAGTTTVGVATAGAAGANEGGGAADVGAAVAVGCVVGAASGAAGVVRAAGRGRRRGRGRAVVGAGRRGADGVGAGKFGTAIRGAGASEGAAVGVGVGTGADEGRGAGVGPSTGPTTGGGVGVGVGLAGRRKSESCAAAGIASSAAMPARRKARVVMWVRSRADG